LAQFYKPIQELLGFSSEALRLKNIRPLGSGVIPKGKESGVLGGRQILTDPIGGVIIRFPGRGALAMKAMNGDYTAL
jgi:hypothetical protein